MQAPEDVRKGGKFHEFEFSTILILIHLPFDAGREVRLSEWC